jgi:hypothetical protein
VWSLHSQTNLPPGEVSLVPIGEVAAEPAWMRWRKKKKKCNELKEKLKINKDSNLNYNSGVLKWRDILMKLLS